MKYYIRHYNGDNEEIIAEGFYNNPQAAFAWLQGYMAAVDKFDENNDYTFNHPYWMPGDVIRYWNHDRSEDYFLEDEAFNLVTYNF